MTIEFGSLNLWAVLVAGIATFMIGPVWYTVLFGKAWQKAQGYSEEKVKQMQDQLSVPLFFGTMIICYLVLAFAMSLIIQATGINTMVGGVALGFLVWIIVACVGLTGHMATDVATSGYLIDTSYQLFYCVGTGALLGVWQ